MSAHERIPQPCLLIVQTSTTNETALKIQSDNTPEHQSWLSCMRDLLKEKGVYELHYAQRQSSRDPEPSSAYIDILISFRTPTDRTAFNHSSAVADTYDSLVTLGFTIIRKTNIDGTPDLTLRGLQGDSIEIVHFDFAPSITHSEVRALFETRLHTYLRLMMDRRRSDAGYGAHLLGPVGKFAALLMGGVEKGGRPLAENKLINWTGGWCSEAQGDANGADARSSYVVILGWQGEQDAKSDMCFLDKLPSKGLRNRRATVEDAKKRWGEELKMEEGDWERGESTHAVFWPLCVSMAEEVREGRYVKNERVFGAK